MVAMYLVHYYKYNGMYLLIINNKKEKAGKFVKADSKICILNEWLAMTQKNTIQWYIQEQGVFDLSAGFYTGFSGKTCFF